MARSGKGWRAGLCALGCAALLWVGAGGCASQGPDLPEFPHYAAADDFLAMQARLQAYHPPDPRVYVYSEHNQSVYESMKDQERRSQAAMKERERMRREWMLRHREVNQSEWEALKRRLAIDEAYNALSAQERASNGRRNQMLYANRFRTYQNRLETLARQQEAIARQQQLNAYRNQQRVQDQIAKLRKKQLQNLTLAPIPAVPTSPDKASAKGAAAPTAGSGAAPAVTLGTP